jgi:hypothetical protein
MPRGQKTRPYPFIYVENRTDRDIFIVFLASRGTLEMHLYATSQPTAIRVAGGETVVIETGGAVAACIRKGRLHFLMRSHMPASNPPAAFVPATEYACSPDGKVLGPIFRIDFFRN